MKIFLLIIIALAFAVSAQAADVGVSISVGQPGFYGQIDIGNFPRPQVIYPEPVVIAPAPVHYGPIYLRVPPGHEKHWAKHCHEYGACGRPVYFVRHAWYNDVYVPEYHARHGRGGGGHGDYHRDNRGRWDSDRENRRGHGHGEGHDRR